MQIESKREYRYWNRAMLLLLIMAGVLLLGSYIGINLFRYTAGIDSDVAAEGLTARAMWVHGTIIPEAFYGSSETRIFNVNLLAAGLYGLTGDMNLSMGIACSVMMVLLIGLYAVLLRRLRFRGLSIAAMVVFLLAAPVSLRHEQILYVQAVYYCIHCILMLVTLMMWLCVMHEPGESRGWIWRTVVASGLAFVISLSGLRAALICYAPLLVTEILRAVVAIARARIHAGGATSGDPGRTSPVMHGVVYAAATLVFAYLGTRMPTSISMGTTRNIRHGFAKFATEVIPNLLECLSLGEQDAVRNGLLLLLFVIAVGTVIWFLIATVRGDAAGTDNGITDDRAWILVFFMLSLVTTMLMCAFTTTESVWRYYFMAWFVISFAIGLLTDCLMARVADFRLLTETVDSAMAEERRLPSIQLRCLAANAVAGLVLLYGVFVWRAELSPILRSPVSNTEYDQIIAWMQENDCYYGYSTYETSNAMTGYADGSVQISAVADLGQMDICKWLTDRTWYGPYVPEDTNTAYVIPVSLEDQFSPMLEAHPEMELGLETEHYMVYHSPLNYSWQ